MKLPRGKLLALVCIVAAASMVTATGAFTSVTADRTADVNVAGDESAYLGLAESEGENGAYATTNGDVLEINLDGDIGVTVEGVNPNAITTMDGVFTVTNQGSQDVELYIKDETEEVSFYYERVSPNRTRSTTAAAR